jgi:hypothetical protein
MALDDGNPTGADLAGAVVECLVYDRDGQAKRRLLMPVSRLLESVRPDRSAAVPNGR